MIKKIALNALILYLRQVVIIIITLYTSRIILLELGIESFGIYSLIAGLVALFGFLSSAISMSCQKIFSQQIEQKDWSGIKKSYSTILLLFVFIMIFICLLSYTVGDWYLKQIMVYTIAIDDQIRPLFVLVVLSSLATLLTTPFQAMIVSNEHMHVYSGISVLETILKLLSAMILTQVTDDKLIIFSTLNFISAVIIVGVYFCYVRFRYKYCRFTRKIQFKEVMKVMKFLGWNIYGSLTFVVRIQGVNLLLNGFFGPAANAARAISFQVFNAVNNFTMSISLAFVPSIMRGNLVGNKTQSKLLLYKSTVITFSIMLAMVLPLILEMSYILEFWLINPPEYSEGLTTLLLIEGLISAVSSQILVSVQATGNIKRYQFCVGSLLLLNLPISYFILDSGYDIYWVMYVAVIISFISLFLKIFLAGKVLDFDISDIYRKVIIPVLLVSSLSSGFLFGLKSILDEGFFSLIIITIISFFTIVLLSFAFYFDKKEKKTITNFILNKIKILR